MSLPLQDPVVPPAVPAEAPLFVDRLFELQALRTPTRIAAQFGGEAINYADLDARANRIARRLQKNGVQPGALVGVLVGRSLDMLAALLGVLKTGAAYLPLDPGYPPDRIAYILDDAATPWLVTDRASRPLDAAAARISLDEVWAESDHPVVTLPRRAGDLAYVIYTSGSTGRPKGVEVTHRGLTNFLCSMRRRPGIAATDVVVAVTTICFDIATLELFLPLTVGARTVIVPADVAADGRQLTRLLGDAGATIMQATPATWRLLLDAGWTGAERCTALCGGEAMSRDLADSLLSRCSAVWNMYGPTETTVWSTLALVGRGTGPIPLGEPIDNTSLHILDERLQPVAPGSEGELLIGGHGVARGYRNRPELTVERFLPDPTEPGQRLYRTGDIVRRGEHGELLFCGRRDHQVKVRGFRIELGEIEGAILRDDRVSQAVVVAVTAGRGEKRLIAAVIGRGGAALEVGAVAARLRSELPAYMVPSRLVALEAMPLTPNGKVDRQALAAALPNDMATTIVPPRDDTERRLLQIWQDVLQLEDVSVTANFFELGGDSLGAAALFARVARDLGRDLPVAALLEAPTIERLAHLVQTECPPARWSPVVPFRTSGSKRPFFFVHGGAGTVLFMRDLTVRLDPERPVYGLQSEGQDGRALEHDTVEKMAALYVAEVRRIQPRGPYTIGGYCFGGIVAFEMAQQLTAQGHHVAFVGLVNAPCPGTSPHIATAACAAPSARAVPRRRFGGLTAANLPWHAGLRSVAMSVGRAARWRWDVLRSLRPMRRLGHLGIRAAATTGWRLPKAWRAAYILAMTERAERLYRPLPYAGALTICRGRGLYCDARLGWAGLAESIETCELGGPQRLRRELIGGAWVGVLGAELSRRLDEADNAIGRPEPIPAGPPIRRQAPPSPRGAAA